MKQGPHRMYHSHTSAPRTSFFLRDSSTATVARGRKVVICFVMSHPWETLPVTRTGHNEIHLPYNKRVSMVHSLEYSVCSFSRRKFTSLLSLYFVGSDLNFHKSRSKRAKVIVLKLKWKLYVHMKFFNRVNSQYSVSTMIRKITILSITILFSIIIFIYFKLCRKIKCK